MQKIHYSIHILAPVEKVWDTMFEKETYTEWTKPFDDTSSFEGDWSEGSEMRFIGTDKETGEKMGMYSRIKENRLHEYMSIEHLGMIKNDVVDTTSEEVKKWTPAFENYTFTEKDGGTEVLIDMDTAPEYKEMFDELWPKALLKLKEIAERSQ